MIALRVLAYGLMIGGCLMGGALDAYAREWKSATLAGLFAAANACIFLWH